MNFSIGSGIQVKENSTSYDGKYSLKCGRIKRYSQGRYGVELVGIKNESSSYGVFWFNENEMKLIDEHHAFAYERPISFDTDTIEAVTAGKALRHVMNTCGMYSSDILVDEMKSSHLPKRILKSGNRTIIFWFDDTKTVVKCAEDDNDNVYSAFTAGLAIKMFGSNSRLKKIIDESLEYQVKKEKKKKSTNPVNDLEAFGKECAKLAKNMPKIGMFND